MKTALAAMSMGEMLLLVHNLDLDPDARFEAFALQDSVIATMRNVVFARLV
jgi:hypothetical protein